jgi:phage pi2 protein 07
LVIKEDMGRRKPKRLKTGDKPEEKVVVFKVRVKESKSNLTTTKKKNHWTMMTMKKKNKWRNQ